MILYCVRHGESIYNAEERIQGQTDIPLSERGRRQAEALARALAEMPLDAIFASPLARAAETAQAIAVPHQLEVRFEDRLKEINAGIFQGLLWSEIEHLHPAEAVRWRAQEPDFIIPTGESRRQLMERGAEALRAIRETGLTQVAVVAHGGVLTAAFKALLEIPAQRKAFALFNASISIVQWQTEFRLHTLNQTEHLRDVNAGRAGNSGDL